MSIIMQVSAIEGCSLSGIPLYSTVVSRKYAPFFCMLSSGKTGEGAYARDRDISVWRPLPTNGRHVDAQSLYFYWLFDGESKLWYDI